MNKQCFTKFVVSFTMYFSKLSTIENIKNIQKIQMLLK